MFDSQTQREVEGLLTGARGIHENLVETAIGKTEVAGTCFYAAILVKEAVSKFVGLAATVRGGCGSRLQGYRDALGAWHGHYWTEVLDAEGERWVLDVTADQFGGPSVYMARSSESGHYRPGPQDEIEQHVRTFGVS